MARVTDAEAVTLRLIDVGDRSLYHALHTSADVMRTIGPVPTADEIDRRFGRVVRHNLHERPGHRAWAVAYGNEACGLVALLRDGRHAEFGIMLLPSAWRRGIGTGALRQVLRTAFGPMGLQSVRLSRRDDGHAIALDRLCRPYGFLRTVGLREGEVGWILDRTRWFDMERAEGTAGRTRASSTAAEEDQC